VLIALAAAITIASLPTNASASGGTNSGGVNSGGVNGGGGGTASPTPIPTGGSFTSFKVIAGYRPGGAFAAAIWTSFSVQMINNATPYVRLTITDSSTGQVVWNSTYQMMSGTIDDDYLPFNSSYVVKVELFDATGRLLDTKSVNATTPPPKDPATAG
jgi:hypothetical protein